MRVDENTVTTLIAILATLNIRGVMIPALDHGSESDFQIFGDSGSRFRSNKTLNRNTSSRRLGAVRRAH